VDWMVKYLDRNGRECTATTSDPTFNFREWCDYWGFTLIWVKCTRMYFDGYVGWDGRTSPWSANYRRLEGKLDLNVRPEIGTGGTYDVPKEMSLSDAKTVVTRLIKGEPIEATVPTELTITTAQLSAAVGERLLFEGSLKRIDTGIGIPNQNVYLYLSPDTLLGTTQTDANGNYELTWTPAEEGIYSIFARFEGAEV